MVGPWPVAGESLPLATATELVSVTLVLSTIEYVIIGLFIGRAVYGKRLRRFSAVRGWEWRSGDPHDSLQAVAPSVLDKVRRRRVKQTVWGEMPQGPFTLWVHKHPWRWRRECHTVLVETKMPFASPGVVIRARERGVNESERYPDGNLWFVEQVITPALSALVRANPDTTWDWTGRRLVVSSTQVKDMDALQDLVCAADKFRALLPEDVPVRSEHLSGASSVITVTV